MEEEEEEKEEADAAPAAGQMLIMIAVLRSWPEYHQKGLRTRRGLGWA